MQEHLKHIRELNDVARQEGKQWRIVPSGHKGRIKLSADQVNSRVVLDFFDNFLYLLQLEDSGFNPDHPDYIPSDSVKYGLEMYSALKDLVDMTDLQLAGNE
jgi:hypothetical protein